MVSYLGAMSKLSPSPTAAVLIIGDEILSGRTRDSNMNTLARFLPRWASI